MKDTYMIKIERRRKTSLGICVKLAVEVVITFSWLGKFHRFSSENID